MEAATAAPKGEFNHAATASRIGVITGFAAVLAGMGAAVTGSEDHRTARMAVGEAFIS
jgi:hypothetical protein